MDVSQASFHFATLFHFFEGLSVYQKRCTPAASVRTAGQPRFLDVRNFFSEETNADRPPSMTEPI